MDFTDYKNINMFSVDYDNYKIIDTNKKYSLIKDIQYNVYRIVTKFMTNDYFVCIYLNNHKTYSNSLDYVLNQFNNL